MLSLSLGKEMHRQSVGSPSSKHHIHGGVIIIDARDDTVAASEDNKKDQAVSSSLAAVDNKSSSDKTHLTSSPTDQKLIHLIPLLTFLCFLILFLSSHNPSPLELSQFKRPLNHIDSVAEMNKFERVSESRKGGVLAIRSVRNLQEFDGKASKYRIYRKFGYF